MNTARLISDGWINPHDVCPATTALTHAASVADHERMYAEDSGWEGDDLARIVGSLEAAIIRRRNGRAEIVLPDGSVIVYHEWANGDVSGYWWTSDVDAEASGPSTWLAEHMAEEAEERYQTALTDLARLVVPGVPDVRPWEIAKARKAFAAAAWDVGRSGLPEVEELATVLASGVRDALGREEVNA